MTRPAARRTTSPVRASVARRIAIGGFAAVNLWWGLWAWIWPQQFFDTFPGLGHHWTAAYPPYNEHLVADLGATFLALGFLLAVASIVDDRRLRLAALATAALFNVLHLAFHAGHAGGLGEVDYAASLATLVAGVLVPAGLAVADLVGRPRGIGSGAGAGRRHSG